MQGRLCTFLYYFMYLLMLTKYKHILIKGTRESEREEGWKRESWQHLLIKGKQKINFILFYWQEKEIKGQKAVKLNDKLKKNKDQTLMLIKQNWRLRWRFKMRLRMSLRIELRTVKRRILNVRNCLS